MPNESHPSYESDRNYLSLTVRVQDTGCGIPKSEHSKIFEPFYRVTTASSGSGVGLYIGKC